MSNKLLLNLTNADIINEINKLKNSGIGGSAESAVLYTPQELTDEQKKQAQANIGVLKDTDRPLQVGDVFTGAVTIDTSVDIDAILAKQTYIVNEIYGEICTLYQVDLDHESTTYLFGSIRQQIGVGEYCYLMADAIEMYKNGNISVIYVSSNTPQAILNQFGLTNTGWILDTLPNHVKKYCVVETVPEPSFAFAKKCTLGDPVILPLITESDGNNSIPSELFDLVSATDTVLLKTTSDLGTDEFITCYRIKKGLQNNANSEEDKLHRFINFEEDLRGYVPQHLKISILDVFKHDNGYTGYERYNYAPAYVCSASSIPENPDHSSPGVITVGTSAYIRVWEGSGYVYKKIVTE